MRGSDFVLGKYTFTNRERVAAAGALYGGFMIDRMASHAKGRFVALVSHAGVVQPDEHGRHRGTVVPRARSGGDTMDQSGHLPGNVAAYLRRGFRQIHKTPTLVIARAA